MNRAGRLASTAAALGLAVGIVGALAIPHTSRSQTAAVPNTFLPLTGTIRTVAAPKHPDYIQLRIVPGTLHEELREKDPSGGPDWVVRSFVADRVVPKNQQRHGVSPVIGHGPCVQLGRDVGGRFGWIDGNDRFRPIGAGNSYYSVLGSCFSTKIATKQEPNVSAMTLVGEPKTHPVVRGGLVWGVLGQPIRSAALSAAGEATTLRPSARFGAFLVFRGPAKSPSDYKLTTQYGTSKPASRGATPPEMLRDVAKMQRDVAKLRRGSRAPVLPPSQPIIPSTVQLMARTADPGGGPSWGMTMGRTKSGMWCTVDQGSVIGDRVGSLDADTGVLSESDPHGQPQGCSHAPFTKRTPIQLSSSYGADADHDKLVAARGKLRLQSGRTTFAGIVDPNADLVTITSPRDIRSVVPSGPGHAIIVVYDGVFGGNTIRFDVHMKDGTTRTMTTFAGI